MKKTLIALGLILGSTAGAQALQVNAGGSLTNGFFGFSFGVTAQSLATLGDYDLDARVTADFWPAASATAVGVDLLVNIPTDALNLYVGPGVGFVTGGGTSTLFASVTGGLNFPVADQFGIFAEGSYRFLNNVNSFTTRFGVSFTF